MTDAETDTSPPPLLIHFYGNVTVPTREWGSTVMMYGDELEVTPTVRALSYDRAGNTWLDLADKPEEQIRRWGSVRYAVGPWPADKPRLEPGSFEASEAAIAAHKQAWMIQDPTDSAQALKEVRMIYGLPPAGSKTVAVEADR